MMGVSALTQDPHLASPWEGEEWGGACGNTGGLLGHRTPLLASPARGEVGPVSLVRSCDEPDVTIVAGAGERCDPHLTSPWEGEEWLRASDAIRGNSLSGPSPSQGEVRWGCLDTAEVRS